MSRLLGPLDSIGRVPPLQQTRIAAFLISAHGALARQLALALPGQFNAGWQTELNAQLYRAIEIVSLLMRATAWTPDLKLPYLMSSWEAAWLPKVVVGMTDQRLGMTVDNAALGHAIHGAIRPAALLPVEAAAADPFVVALRRIEFESGRLIQAEIHFLKSDDLYSLRERVSAAVGVRHRQVRTLWADLLEGMNNEREVARDSSDP